MVSSFIPIFNEKSRKMVDLMERKLGGKIDMQRTMFKAAAETIMTASFGLNWPMQNKRGDDIHDLIIFILEGLQKRVQRVWLWNPIYKFTQEYRRNIVKFHAFHQQHAPDTPDEWPTLMLYHKWLLLKYLRYQRKSCPFLRILLNQSTFFPAPVVNTFASNSDCDSL